MEPYPVSYTRCDVPFDELVGKRLLEIHGLDAGSDRVLFVCSDGTRYELSHHQDCCENVALEEVVGEELGLFTGEILDAYESSNRDKNHNDYESATWTFYTIRTIATTVVLRWLGTSNGYYSEEVDFERLDPDTPYEPEVVQEDPRIAIHPTPTLFGTN